MLTIGQAAERSGLTPKMIRYYESLGLFTPSSRSAAGYRQYNEQDMHSLHFIRSARDLGFSLEQIAELGALWRDKDRASAEVKRLALGHIAQLEHKATVLQGMADTLKTLAANCHGDSRPDCPILEGLEHHTNDEACHSDTKAR